MRSLRRFLTPGWMLGLLAVILFTWACFAFLAPWQLGKSEDLDVRNSRLTESVEAAPAPLAEVVTSPQTYTEREWRLVTVGGSWQPDAEALLRLRSVDGEAVYQVLTVFDPVDGPEVLINRGYVPVGENNTVPDYPAAPVGQVDITARLRAAEAGVAEPVRIDGIPAVRTVDPVVLGTSVGHSVVTDGYLQLTGDQPGSLTPAPIPGIESGPYLSYGLQWLTFGVLAPAALLYFAWAELRARRRDAEEAADHTNGGSMGSDASSVDDDMATTTGVDNEIVARQRALQDRYGQRNDAEQRRAFRRADRLQN